MSNSGRFLSKSDRDYIIKSLIDCIKCITDLKYQKKAWLGQSLEIEESFDDFIEVFFGNINTVLNREKEFNFPKEKLSAIKDFYTKFESFSDLHYEPSEFVGTSKWKEIQNVEL